MNSNYDSNDYGFNPDIIIKSDNENQCVLISDAYGFFLPIPFIMWDKDVNTIAYRKVKKQFPFVPHDQAYDMAIQLYCTTYKFNYICLN